MNFLMKSTPDLLVPHPEIGRLLSPVADREKPRYRWHSFTHSYSKELVGQLLDEFGVHNGRVLDPFCGGGTTLLACKERGINAHGFDIMPFPVFLSNVKTRHFDPKKLKQRLNSFQPIRSQEALPEVGIIDKAFSKRVKDAILDIRGWTELIHNKHERAFFTLALLSILDKIGSAVKSGGFLRLIKRRKTYAGVIRLFTETADKMISDCEVVPLSGDAKTIAFLGDARSLPKKIAYDAVITSPPYPNRHDYTRIYALELLTSFIDSNDELKKLRYKTLRSHVEARKKFESTGYTPPMLLSTTITKLKEKKLNNSKIVEMLKGYFEDMHLVIKSIHGCLKKGGKVAIVVSNVRYAGIPVPVDIIIADLGKQLDFEVDAIWVGRERGNSSQQMGEYKRRPNRESVVIMKKVN